MPDRLSLGRLRAAAQECRGCELYQDATQAVMGDGPVRADLMVIGEQPGDVVKHFRFSGTRGKQRIHKSPSRVHVAACGPWLVAELDLVRPRGLVLLGGSAGKALYGRIAGGFEEPGEVSRV